MKIGNNVFFEYQNNIYSGRIEKKLKSKGLSRKSFSKHSYLVSFLYNGENKYKLFKKSKLHLSKNCHCFFKNNFKYPINPEFYKNCNHTIYSRYCRLYDFHNRINSCLSLIKSYFRYKSTPES